MRRLKPRKPSPRSPLSTMAKHVGSVGKVLDGIHRVTFDVIGLNGINVVGVAAPDWNSE